MTTSRTGLLAALGAAGFFASGWILVKLIYRQGADPMTLLSSRAALAVLVIWGLSGLQGLPQRRLPRADLARSLGIGVFYVLPSLAYFQALQRIPASLGAVLLYTFPAWTALLTRLLYGERLSPVRVASLASTFLGIVFVVRLYDWSPGSVDPLGVVLGLSQAVGIALYSTLLQPVTRRQPTFGVLAWVFLAAAVVAAGIRSPLALFELSRQAQALILTLAVLASALPTYLWMTAVRHLGASRSGIVATVEPVVAIGLAYLLLGERLEALQLVGVVLVLGGILLLRAERWLPAASLEAPV